MKSRTRFLSAISSILLWPSVAWADALSAGVEAYNRGDIAKAVEKWQKSNKPEAAWRIGVLAEDGKLAGCDKVVCAYSWFRKAAEGGHIPSLTQLAILNFNNGHEKAGLDQFAVAARWNDPLARQLLGEMGQTVPEPDLYLAAVEAERQRQMTAQAALEQQQAQAAYLLGCALGGGCASSTGAPSTRGGAYNRTYTLQQQWFAATTDQMCAYANGTVLNVGSRSCPDAVQGH